MAQINVNTNRTIQKMKPMHGGGQPPVNAHATDDSFHYLTEAGIPYSRLHDVEWAFGGGKYVDIPVIFRNFDADENDPANYDFAFTDLLLNQLIKAGVEPYYRLGVTIECAYKVKHFTIMPPKDFDKWPGSVSISWRTIWKVGQTASITRSPTGRSGMNRTTTSAATGREHRKNTTGFMTRPRNA